MSESIDDDLLSYSESIKKPWIVRKELAAALKSAKLFALINNEKVIHKGIYGEYVGPSVLNARDPEPDDFVPHEVFINPAAKTKLPPGYKLKLQTLEEVA